MSQRVSKVVTHHLGMSCSARGEVHEHGVGVLILPKAYEGACGADALMKVEPSVGNLRPYGYAMLQCVAVGACSLYVVYDVIVATCHNCLDVCRITAILDVVCTE